MRGLTVPRRRRLWLPNSQLPRIDWSNPLTHGLLACYVPASQTLVDLCNRGPILAYVTPSAANVIGGPEGLAMSAQTTSRGAWTTITPAVQINQPVTLFWRGMATANAVTDQCGLIAVRYSNNAGTTPFVSYGLARGAGASLDNDSFCLQWGSGATYVSAGFNFSWSTNYNKIFSLAASLAFPNSNKLYVNGILKSTPNMSVPLTFPYGTGPRLYIGCVPGETTANDNLVTNIAMIFNAQLTDQQVADLSFNPYGFLIYPQDENRTALARTVAVTAPQPLADFATNSPRLRRIVKMVAT